MTDKEESKPKMHVLYKESGQEVKVNDESLEHALGIGWSKKKPASKK